MENRKSAARKVARFLVIAFAAFGVFFMGLVVYFVVNPEAGGETSAVAPALSGAGESSGSGDGKFTSIAPGTDYGGKWPTSPTAQAKVFEFNPGYDDSNSLYSRYVGSITNVSGETRYFVRVRGTFEDEDGNAIDTDWTFACGAEGLRPGETTKFTLSVPRDDRIARVVREVFDYE